MKFSDLRSIGHNMADSLASGIGLMIGVYQTDIFGEAARSQERFIEVDFLSGTTSGGAPSAALSEAIIQYANVLNELCERHGARVGDFRELQARYSVTHLYVKFVVTVQDLRGRRAVDEYRGRPGQRVKHLDALGRVRKIHQRAANGD